MGLRSSPTSHHGKVLAFAGYFLVLLLCCCPPAAANSHALESSSQLQAEEEAAGAEAQAWLETQSETSYFALSAALAKKDIIQTLSGKKDNNKEQQQQQRKNGGLNVHQRDVLTNGNNKNESSNSNDEHDDNSSTGASNKSKNVVARKGSNGNWIVNDHELPRTRPHAVRSSLSHNTNNNNNIKTTNTEATIVELIAKSGNNNNRNHQYQQLHQQVSEVQPTAEQLRTRVPLAAKCVFWMIGGCMACSVVLYVVPHVNALMLRSGEERGDSKTRKNVDVSSMEGGEKKKEGGNEEEELAVLSGMAWLAAWSRIKINRWFTAEALQGGAIALSFAPMVCTLLLFVMLRARTQLVDLQGPQFQKAELGMTCLTISVVLYAFDGVSIRVQSEFFGNISYSLSVLFNVIGGSIMLWALVALQSKAHPHSVISCCITALTSLYLIASIGIPLVHIYYRVSKDLPGQHINKLVSTVNVTPLLCVVCMHAYFRPWTTTDDAVPHFVSSSVYICTVSQFSMVVGGIFSSESNKIIDAVGAIIRTISVILFTLFFAVLVYLLVMLPAVSSPVSSFLILVVTSTVLSVWLAILNEAVTFQTASPSQHHVTLCTNLKITSSLSQLASLLLLYIHLRPNILLAEEHPSKFLHSATPFLQPAVTLVIVGVLVQAAAEIFQFMLKNREVTVLSTAGLGVGLGCTLVGLAMMIEAAVAV